MTGFIKIHRQITEWEWYKDIPCRILFEHCLFKANYEQKKWQGIVIERGSFITSYENLAFETGLTVRQIRTALNKLKTTGELTHQTTSRYSIITVKNWTKYQLGDKQNDKQMTSERQTNDKQATTTKEVKEVKKYKKEINNTHTNNVCVELTKEEKEILVRYAQKSGARHPQAYIHTLIKNGGYKEVLETAKKTTKKVTPKAPEPVTESEREKAEIFRKQVAEKFKQTGRFI